MTAAARAPISAATRLERLRRWLPPGGLAVMNVCGGHERSISMAGLRSMLPDGLRLIPGPGCPVCVCPEEDIHAAIQLALHEDVTLVAFGDMLRVPCNAPKGEVRSLEAARAAGADVRPVASPQQARRVALDAPDRQVVFFAAGFETTMAPVAAMVAQGLPPNLTLLVSGRRTWPAVQLLLDGSRDGGEPLCFDALIAPGHVATVMGADEWRFVAEDHGLPVAVAGFSIESILDALNAVLAQQRSGRRGVDNCYPELVSEAGNPSARRVLDEVFEIVDAPWRGLGVLRASGYALRERFGAHDARRRFALVVDGARRRAGEMPPGCDCARVVLGRIAPNECVLYGRACTPREPVGPCMVSDEGACRIWWAAGERALPRTKSARPARA